MKHDLQCHNSTVTADDSFGEAEIRKAEPRFFDAKFGKRETFTFYRGAVICRHTVKFTGRSPERRTVAYLLVTDENGHAYTSHINGDFATVKQAQNAIDLIYDTGVLHPKV